MRLRVDVFTGVDGEKTPEFRDSWVQLRGECPEDIADKIRDIVLENLECILEGNEDDTDDDI